MPTKVRFVCWFVFGGKVTNKALIRFCKAAILSHFVRKMTYILREILFFCHQTLPLQVVVVHIQ